MYGVGMAHFHIKKKKGRPYLYVREIARIHGRPKVTSQTYIGPPELVAALARDKGKREETIRVEEFGALWLAEQIDRDIDLCRIVDEILPRGKREEGPSVGEYFLYCVWNRMVDATSKNKLANWYRRTAIQHIRPLETNLLTSKEYWKKWDKVDEDKLRGIASRFFERLWETESPESDCLLSDTTNYYTFMSGHTPSELARRGKNKAGRHNLRQIGLGLLVDRESRLPLFYSVYPGNVHDSRHFGAVMDEMFGVVCGLNRTKAGITVVIDKGTNSESNYSWIDEHSKIHFVTNYSTYFASELAETPLERFEVTDIPKNRRLTDEGCPEECELSYRTAGECWGRERSVVVTHNPRTARKQEIVFQGKLENVRRELLSMQAKVRAKAPQWRDPDIVRNRCKKLCERLRFPDIYNLDFVGREDGLKMGFRKDAKKEERKRAMFGKCVIVTDNTDWATNEIVAACRDRWIVEDRFRLSHDEDLVGTRPVRHWTDGKIRCHLFACVVAMTYLRRMELRLSAKGINRTAKDVMDDMRHFHSVLRLGGRSAKPVRQLEAPTEGQAEILAAFGYYVDESGVLRVLHD